MLPRRPVCSGCPGCASERDPRNLEVRPLRGCGWGGRGIRVHDGSRSGVVGGGPAGSLCAYFLLTFARRMDLNLCLDIYEPRDFTQTGPDGCNMCGGIVSDSLVQALAGEGIGLPL